jgi:hypothetical protein
MQFRLIKPGERAQLGILCILGRRSDRPIESGGAEGRFCVKKLLSEADCDIRPKQGLVDARVERRYRKDVAIGLGEEI